MDMGSARCSDPAAGTTSGRFSFSTRKSVKSTPRPAVQPIIGYKVDVTQALANGLLRDNA